VSLPRTLRTLRHQWPSQLAARVLHEARLRAPGLLQPRLPAEQDARAAALGAAPLLREPTPHDRGLAALWSHGEAAPLGLRVDRHDWSGSGEAGSRPKLWRYERHYHAELVALARLGQLAEARALVQSWSAACPAPLGDAWEPYVVARRILSWSLALAALPALGPLCAPLLAPQLRFLARRLEWHLLGNHLLTDAAALCAGAAALELRGGEAIFARGAALLAGELRRQILPDGGHSERTPHYHALVLRDALWALGLARARGLPLPIEPYAERLARHLAVIRRGRELPRLNDTTPAADALADEALSLAAALGVPAGAAQAGTVELPDTGWTLVRDGAHELLFEHGPLGPDENPGHGHSDALSYELIWGCDRIITDSGATTYDAGPQRDFERSSRAHATVTVDGEGPDELWSSFRAGARGRVTRGPGLSASVRAAAGWTHERAIDFTPGVRLRVTDRVQDAQHGAQIVSRLPLASPGALRGLSLRVLRGERLYDERGSEGQGFFRPRDRPVIAVRADGEGVVQIELCASST